MAEHEDNISGKQRSEDITSTKTQRRTIIREKTLADKPMDPTGVVLDDSISDNPSFFYEEINVDKTITQTLERYVLPLLPTIPLHIHNIHLKCEDSTSCYQLLQLPSYKQNIGKYQVVNIDN